jgi:hypothetical protein
MYIELEKIASEIRLFSNIQVIVLSFFNYLIFSEYSENVFYV